MASSSPWPKTIIHPFRGIPAETGRDTDFYGPYNKLLYHLFPADTNFIVFPGSYPPRHSSIANTPAGVEFTVLYNNSPVLLLQLSAPDLLRWPSARADVDTAARRRLRDLAPLCPLPKLYAVTAFGTKLRFYAATTGEGDVVDIDPPLMDRPRPAPGHGGLPPTPISPRSPTVPSVRISTVSNDSNASNFSVRSSDAVTIPLGRWNSDVLEDEGANLLKQAVAEIIARIYLADDYD
ncbi:hypothetical protein FB45DRAFT_788406 [Roridomyces roridus]|uniref:Uncharacterized protein n=1 Tax=Roridomyces roridus TaxID=1738132 RepID=A0AAD7C0Q4_9AGAR|nr:hypothetical protein FB45DRAFT_788406 [Roridomyces roridus]